jgi:hypothetical protein
LSFHFDSPVSIVEPMIARRIAAVFVMFLMAHLDIARAYAACARRDAHGPAEHQQMMQDHAGMTSMPTAPADAPDRAPAQAECCRAMASCVLTLALGDGTTADNAWQSRATLVEVAQNAPSSRSCAPEPPPPRA